MGDVILQRQVGAVRQIASAVKSNAAVLIKWLKNPVPDLDTVASEVETLNAQQEQAKTSAAKATEDAMAELKKAWNAVVGSTEMLKGALKAKGETKLLKEVPRTPKSSATQARTGYMTAFDDFVKTLTERVAKLPGVDLEGIRSLTGAFVSANSRRTLLEKDRNQRSERLNEARSQMTKKASAVKDILTGLLKLENAEKELAAVEAIKMGKPKGKAKQPTAEKTPG